MYSKYIKNNNQLIIDGIHKWRGIQFTVICKHFGLEMNIVSLSASLLLALGFSVTQLWLPYYLRVRGSHDVEKAP